MSYWLMVIKGPALDNNGPKIDPLGTPYQIFWHELSESAILVPRLRCLK